MGLHRGHYQGHHVMHHPRLYTPSPCLAPTRAPPGPWPLCPTLQLAKEVGRWGLRAHQKGAAQEAWASAAAVASLCLWLCNLPLAGPSP